jgi:hypothetical protein
MSDKPIIFSGPMVKALLDGRKTQTRRILKSPYGTMEWLGNGQWRPICTKVFPGDRLYVREAVRFCSQLDSIRPAEMSHYEPRRYEADDLLIEPSCMMIQPGRLRPSIHMPRWASRLTLIVTDVRVQRVQEISAEDCEREGIKISDGALVRDGYMLANRKDCSALWNSIHGPDSWARNGWVCAVTFTVRKGNIDQ